LSVEAASLFDRFQVAACAQRSQRNRTCAITSSISACGCSPEPAPPWERKVDIENHFKIHRMTLPCVRFFVTASLLSNGEINHTGSSSTCTDARCSCRRVNTSEVAADELPTRAVQEQRAIHCFSGTHWLSSPFRPDRRADY
jgi:hypothetical protein